MKETRKAPGGGEKRLVLFPGALGDFICFLPALDCLVRSGRVDVLARSEFLDLLGARVRGGPLERHEVNRLFVPGGARDNAVLNFFRSYACVFSWTGSGQPVFARELQRAARGNARLFPFRSPGTKLHQTDYYLSCLGEAPSPNAIPAISIRSEAVAWSEAYRDRHGLKNRPLLALAPGSGAAEKNWPADYFRAVADWWRETAGGAVVVCLGPVEEERGGYGSTFDRCLIVRNAGLARLAALLSRCDIYLGNDSGVSHLAAAAGIPTVALFGPTDPSAWAPRGPQVTVVSRQVSCSPCAIPAMKSCAHRRCLSRLEPGDVTAELQLLKKVVSLTRTGSQIRVNANYKFAVEGGRNVIERDGGGV